MTQHEVMKDKDYNLVSTLYHSLQGAETTGIFIQDAQREGDDELTEYFRHAQSLFKQLAEDAKVLLSKRI